MNIKKTKEYVKKAIQNKFPVHLWGRCGIEKSQLIKQIADEEMRQFIDLRMSSLASADLNGFLDMLPKKGSDAIILIDELNLLPIAMQHSVYQLVLDRAIGDEYKLPEEVDIVVAKNESRHGANMPTPIRNRFVHIEIEPDLSV